MVALGLYVAPTYALDVAATQVAFDSALSYLENTQHDDGSWGENDEMRYVTTATAVEALSTTNQNYAAYYNGVAWLENYATPNVDYAARKILALSNRDNSAIYELSVLKEARQDNDKGLGLNSVYREDVVDSALALRAFIAMGDSENQTLLRDYLLATQLSGGGWGMHEDSTANLWATAEAVISLNMLVSQSSNSGVSNATWNKLNSVTGNESSVILSSVALAIFRNFDSQLTLNVDILLSNLMQAQSNGAWEDTYSTAMVLRTLGAILKLDSSDAATRVSVNDQTLRGIINQQLGKNAFDSLNRGELAKLTNLDLLGLGITDLTGLEFATNLQQLIVDTNTPLDVVSELAAEIHSDGDNIANANDNCPYIDNVSQANLDGDAYGDACDTDLDGDTLANAGDNCPSVPNVTQSNIDGDSTGDVCDTDIDGDAIVNASDNCPYITNASQANFDGDANGDVCDTDTDNDGMPTAWETNYALNNYDASDKNGDPDSDLLVNLLEYQEGTDPRDPDSDGDSLSDGIEVAYASEGLSPTFGGDAAADFDQDNLSNADEITWNTGMNNPDSDQDGTLDGDEVAVGRDPLLNEPVLVVIITSILN